MLSYNVPEWSTASLYRIGESFEGFAKSLREYPVPDGLTPEEEDAYLEQLNVFALAFEEQAIEAYRSGYGKAMELKIYNRHTRNIREALGRLSSQDFPPIVEIGTEQVIAEGKGSGGKDHQKVVAMMRRVATLLGLLVLAAPACKTGGDSSLAPAAEVSDPARVQFDKAVELMDQGADKYDASIKAFRAAIALEPSLWEAHLNIGCDRAATRAPRRGRTFPRVQRRDLRER